MKVTGSGKKTTEMEKAYICKFYHVDGAASLAYSLERKAMVIRTTYSRLKRLGTLGHYIRLWDSQFEEEIS